MTLEIPGPSFGQAQNCDWVKLVNWISNPSDNWISNKNKNITKQ